MTRVFVQIPESNNDGHSIDSMYLHGFRLSGSGREGTVPTSGWLGGGGAHAPGAPLLLPKVKFSSVLL